jgi:hypothetical protein
MAIPGFALRPRRTWLAIAAGALALIGAGLALWPDAGTESLPVAVTEASPAPGTPSARLDSPEVLEAPLVPAGSASSPSEARGPARTTTHRKQKVGMRDDVIDPFAR